MKKLVNSSKNRFSLALVLITIIGGSSPAYTATIGFNNSESLLAAVPYRPGDRAVSLEETVFYKEHGMEFTDGVNPPDPALPQVRQCPGGFVRMGHFHLGYEDPAITFGVVSGKFAPVRRTPTGALQPVANPENEPRLLYPMSFFGVSGAVVQMIYDPNNDGVPDPFNLISIDVHFGTDNMGNPVSRKLDVGTKDPARGISVYNNLTSGFRWFLIDATNLTRATLEFKCEFGSEGLAVIDNIVFEPASSRNPVTATALTPAETIDVGQARPLKLEDVLTGGLTLSEDVLLHQDSPIFAILEVEKPQLMLQGPSQDSFKVRGNMELGAESNGIDVLNEEIIVTFDGFNETIPAGGFRCTENGEGKKTCEFKGTSGGITEMEMAIGEGKFEFQLQAEGLDLFGIDVDSPVLLSLQVGDDLGLMELRFGPEIIVNDFITFTPRNSTFDTTSNSIGCPAGFVGKFSFSARLTNVSDSVFTSLLFSSLMVKVATLTNGNLLQNADKGPGGMGARLTVPEADGFADGVLSPGELVDVPFVICLREIKPFTLVVDVLGVVN